MASRLLVSPLGRRSSASPTPLRAAEQGRVRGPSNRTCRLAASSRPSSAAFRHRNDPESRSLSGPAGPTISRESTSISFQAGRSGRVPTRDWRRVKGTSSRPSAKEAESGRSSDQPRDRTQSSRDDLSSFCWPCPPTNAGPRTSRRWFLPMRLARPRPFSPRRRIWTPRPIGSRRHRLPSRPQPRPDKHPSGARRVRKRHSAMRVVVSR